MKKVLKLRDLDCANCAAKMETAVAKLDGVKAVTVSFMSQKMTLELEDGQLERLLPEVVRVCKRVEPDCEILL